MPHRRGHSRNSTIWDHRSYERAPKHAAGLIGLGVVGSNPLQNVLDVKGSEQQMARTHPAAFQQPAWCRLAGPFSPSMSRVPLGLPQRAAQGIGPTSPIMTKSAPLAIGS